MVHPQLKALLIGLALVTGACDARADETSRSSITVKLPPARQAVPRPAFSFDSPSDAPSQGNAHSPST
jgi:hypothetical protein